MNPILKSLLLSLCCLILTALPVQAEEGKWIDGIRFRYGNLSNFTTFRLPWVGEKDTIIEVNQDFSHLAPTPMLPIAITLSETLMNSWSFRGAFFEYQHCKWIFTLSEICLETTTARSIRQLSV